MWVIIWWVSPIDVQQGLSMLCETLGNMRNFKAATKSQNFKARQSRGGEESGRLFRVLPLLPEDNLSRVLWEEKPGELVRAPHLTCEGDEGSGRGGISHVTRNYWRLGGSPPQSHQTQRPHRLLQPGIQALLFSPYLFHCLWISKKTTCIWNLLSTC